MLRRRLSVFSVSLVLLVVSLAGCGGDGGGGGSTPAPPSPDLFIDGWYITQSTQSYTRGVPLIANRDGFLRIFVRANTANTWIPEVWVTINGGSPTLLSTPSGVNGTSGVPTSVSEGNLAFSWGMDVPASSLFSGTTVKIEVDPENLIEEGDETNNTIDATLPAQTAKVFPITVIPVTQSSLTGRVDSDGRTLAGWVDRLQRMYPVRTTAGGIDIIKGSIYTTEADLNTGASPTPSQDGWDQLLLELENKRKVDPVDKYRYYFGAVRVDYPSGGGIAGVGYRVIDASSLLYRTALGWDETGYTDGGNYPEVLAHEVGHNFGRYHAPCGDPAAVDPSWPSGPAYKDGAIGVCGYDVVNHVLKPSTYKDIMGYCDMTVWVSDYTYKGIMNFRDASVIGDIVEGRSQECLLVSGRVVDGNVVLEPAFRVITVPQPPLPGSHTLQLQDAQGNTLLETSFEPVEIADLPGDPVKHFTFTLPLGAGKASNLRSLRIAKDRMTKVVKSSSIEARLVGGREPVSVRMRSGQAHLSWDPMAHPKVMVQDPRTGEVIAFARSGSLDVATDALELDVTFSDGVNSVRKLLKVQ